MREIIRVKQNSKNSMAAPAFIALSISSGFVLIQMIANLIVEDGNLGGIVAEKLVIGIGLFPVVFIVVWAWLRYSKKGIESDSLYESIPIREDEYKLSKWNYVGAIIGLFMIVFLFIPKMSDDNLESHFYIGAVFWLSIVIYSSINIFKSMKTKKT